MRLNNGAVSWTETDDSTIVVLDMRTSRYMSLNPSGSQLWLLLVEGATEGELTSALMEKYELSEEAARADVEAFLDDLRGRELLTE
jgi:hypothetical protein